MTTTATARRSQRSGARVEALTAAALRSRGVLAFQIATPKKGDRYVGKVAGDFWGVTVTGQAVLVECKFRTEAGKTRRPRPSDFEPHQIAALRDVHRRGGVAFVAWLKDGAGIVLEYAVDIVGAE